MAIIKDGGVMVDESDIDLRIFMSDPYFVHFIGMIAPLRPGVDSCFQQLEYSYFKPGTSRNDLYHFRVITWMEIMWGIVSIPVGDKHLMESVAAACRLKVVDGVPCLLTSESLTSFPFSNSQTFTLENISSHPIYQNKTL